MNLGLCLCQMLPHLEHGGARSQGIGSVGQWWGGGELKSLGMMWQGSRLSRKHL